MKEKDFPKEGKLKFKSLFDVKEIKSLLEGAGSPVKGKAASKGVTPAATTAATSRHTQSPTRKAAKRDDSAETKLAKTQASQRKPSAARSGKIHKRKRA